MFSGSGETAVQHGIVSWGRSCAEPQWPGSIIVIVELEFFEIFCLVFRSQACTLRSRILSNGSPLSCNDIPTELRFETIFLATAATYTNQ